MNYGSEISRNHWHTAATGSSGNNVNRWGAGVLVGSAGALSGTTTTNGGASVGGRLVMNEGSLITRNRHTTAPQGGRPTGGGVAIVGANATFDMNGGTISYNTAMHTGADASAFYGTGGGVALQWGATFNLRSGLITENFANFGGGIAAGYLMNHTGTEPITRVNLNVAYDDQVIISHNRAYRRGGGLILVNATMNLSGLGEKHIIHNRTNIAQGGGMSIEAMVNRNDQPTFNTATPGLLNIAHNTSGAHGGGINVGQHGRLHFSSGHVHNNRATTYGGGISSTLTSRSYISGGLIEENTAQRSGGGTAVFGSTATITKSGGIIQDNTAYMHGGGVHIRDTGTFNMGTLANSQTTMIYDNTARDNGGGIHLAAGTLNLGTVGTRNIIHNTAANHGGGIWRAGGTITSGSGVRNIQHNTATAGAGGGIHNTGALTVNDNMMITDNEALLGGGGINQIGTAAITMSGGTINNNEANYGGGVRIETNAAALRATGGSITNNTAFYDGGGIWTNNHDYRNTIATTAYANLTTSASVNFNGNVAENGAYMPPTNWSITGIRGNGISVPNLVNQLNNYDVNFRGVRVVVEVPFEFIKTEDDETTPLQEAVFSLYGRNVAGDDWSQTPIISGVRSAQTTGLVRFEDLTPGQYKLVETEAPSGFETPATGNYWVITVATNGTISTPTSEGDILDFILREGSFFLPNRRSSTSFEFIKTRDDETTPLPEAVFSLYGRNAAGDDWSQTPITSGVRSAQTTGLVRFEGLTPGGEYKLVETEAPSGFETPATGNYWVITVAANGTISLPASEGDIPDFILREGSFFLPNIRILVPFEFIKTRDDGTTPLPEAVFSLYGRNAAGDDWSQTPITSGVRSAQTTGLVRFTGLTAGGQYKLVETAAPDGFDTPPEGSYWIINIAVNGTISTPTSEGDVLDFIVREGSFFLPNRRTLIPFEFVKTGENGTTPLYGAVFSLYRRNAAGTDWEDEPIVSGVRSALATGLVRFTGLIPGNQYQLVETQAPSGFYTPPTGSYWIISVAANGTISTPTSEGDNIPDFILREGSFFLPNMRSSVPITGLFDNSNLYISYVLGASLIGLLPVCYKIYKKRRQFTY